MNSKFKFLTSDDYNLLWEKGKIVTYHKNEVILPENHPSQVIYLLRKGSVRVERSASGRGVAIACLNPGDIFGEMSLLEEETTSAAIIAQEEVEVSILEKTTLYSLLVSIPGLSIRFYQSIAYNLSLRLRETSFLLSSLMEKTGFSPQSRQRRTGLVGQDDIPPELVSEVELFKNNLVGIEQSLRAKQLNEAEAQGAITKACNMLVNSMREQIIQESDIEKAIGTYIFRETFSFLMLSSFIDRAFRQSCGYANDSVITEILSQNEPEGDGYLGIYIDRWIRSIPTCLALKNRGSIITETIKELAVGWTSANPMPVTSLVSGSANEILDLYLNANPPNVHVTCVDCDREHLAYAANLAHKLGFVDCLTFIQDSIFLLSQGCSNIPLPPQQMIYSVSVSNYLQDKELIALLNWIYDRLLPNGTVILGNFYAANPDRVLLEHILEWHLLYRCAEQLETLFGQSKFGSLPVEVHSDEYGVELFVVCTKAWE
ncbi:cyclic nucleotide-binding domain-containing protein [Pleurocapsales cyanobacterium LEGE 06147]|nr:cyclic nucleotide-binding domain-containing protein [Pleurocapsales cyanobacterium LEGE 06147]